MITDVVCQIATSAAFDAIVIAALFVWMLYTDPRESYYRDLDRKRREAELKAIDETNRKIFEQLEARKMRKEYR